MWKIVQTIGVVWCLLGFTIMFVHASQDEELRAVEACLTLALPGFLTYSLGRWMVWKKGERYG